MNSRPALLLAAGAGAAAAFVLLTRSVRSRPVLEHDGAVRDRVVERQSTGGRAVATALGPIGKEWVHAPVALAVAGYAWRQGAGRAAAVPAVASVASELANRVMERRLRVRQPPPGRHDPHKPSYPSGHAMETTAVSLAAAWLLIASGLAPARWVAPAAAGLSFLSGAGRLYLDRHWSSDLAGGWLAGIAIGATIAAGGEALLRRP